MVTLGEIQRQMKRQKRKDEKEQSRHKARGGKDVRLLHKRKVKRKPKQVLTRKHKHDERKECWHARKGASRKWHNDVVAENTIKKASDESEMTWVDCIVLH